jgi:hypothetical protein
MNRTNLLKLPREFIDSYCTTEKGQLICYFTKPHYICPIQIGDNFYTSVNVLNILRFDPQVRSLLQTYEIESVLIREEGDTDE